MKVKQFSYDDTNLGYVLWSGSEAVVIDGGAPEQMVKFAISEGLEIKYVTNTHEHMDHIHGNDALMELTNAALIAPDEMCSIKILRLGNEQIEAFPAPGHSEKSIVFYFEGSLVTGDTLFNGTVGNCYTKDYELYFDSLQKVLRFPGSTKIYAGHDIFDYTTGVMDKIDPDNPMLAEYKALYSKTLLVTTLEQELQVNPFIRFDDPALDEFRSGLGMPLGTPYERWRAMMSIH